MAHSGLDYSKLPSDWRLYGPDGALVSLCHLLVEQAGTARALARLILESPAAATTRTSKNKDGYTVEEVLRELIHALSQVMAVVQAASDNSQDKEYQDSDFPHMDIPVTRDLVSQWRRDTPIEAIKAMLPYLKNEIRQIRTQLSILRDAKRIADIQMVEFDHGTLGEITQYIWDKLANFEAVLDAGLEYANSTPDS